MNINLAQPGIYEWRIEGIGVYIGKSKRLQSRIQEYPNNVRKLMDGAPYRKSRQNDYRPIHHELRRAHDGQIAVSVTVLENCPEKDLNKRERHWISVRRKEAAMSGPPVLNAN